MPHPIPDEALENHIAILGKTGAGKTVTAKGAVEKLLDAGERVCIIDPTGAWWGLRLMADGKTPGFDVAIFGGSHADIELNEHVAQPLARILGKSNLPAIIDTSLMTVGARTRFFADFAEAIFRENDSPMHLVIDEAHLFAPQGRVNDPLSGRMVNAANNLVSGGRSRGFRIMLLSQRAAKLHKDSLTQVETMVAMRLIAPQDRKAVEDWVGAWGDKKKGAEIVASLPSLDRGEAWLWAPEHDVLSRVRFPMIKTFDNSATLKRGETRLQPKTLSEIDLSAVRAALDVPEPEAKIGKPGKVDQAAIEAARREGHEEGYVKGYQAGKADGLKHTVPGTIDALKRAIEAVEQLAGEPAEVTPEAPRASSPKREIKEKKNAGPVHQTSTQVAREYLVEALQWYASVGVKAPSREMLAAAVGFEQGDRGINAALADLMSGGVVRFGVPSTVSLLDPPTAKKDAAVVAAVRSRLTGHRAAIYDTLLGSPPISVNDLLQAVGLSLGGPNRTRYLNTLLAMGVLEKTGAKVTLSAWARGEQERVS